MKIGIVSPYAYPRPGGANSYIRESYSELRRLGHDVRIITAPWGDDPPAQDVIQIGQAIAVPYNGAIGRITLSLRLEWLVSHMLERERFDIIHHHEPLVPFLSMQILDSARCPNVATFHAFGGFSFSYWAGRVIGNRYLNKLDARIAVSSAARHFISSYFPGDYRIIPNGVDVHFYASAKPFPEYHDGKINILFVGRLEPRKGAMYLMEAYAKLKLKHPELRLILCSVGPLLGRLRRFVRSNRLDDVLFAGRVSDADKARFYKTAHIFCAPSTGQESFGIVLLEAMAAELPSFDGHRETTFALLHPIAPHYSTLYKFDPNDLTKVIPDVAAATPEVSADKLTYTIKVRTDVKFHDGPKMTSDDILATYNKIIFPPSGVLSPRAGAYAAVHRLAAAAPHPLSRARYLTRHP